MTDNSDELRRKARARLDTPEGDGVLLALGRLLEAQETERGANSDEAREAARQDALKAGAAVNEALGITALRRCRVLVEIDDLDAGAAVDERTLFRPPQARGARRKPGWPRQAVPRPGARR